MIHEIKFESRVSVAQRIESTSLVPTNTSGDFPRIRGFFDGLDYTIDRSTQSLMKAKYVFLALLVLVLSVVEMIRIAVIILSR
jgi:hypothetical protein